MPTWIPQTAAELETLKTLWPDYSICEIAKKMGRAKSCIMRWGIQAGLPAKPKTFRRATAVRLEKGKQAIKLRADGWTWQQIAEELKLSSRGNACTLAGEAGYAGAKLARREIYNPARRQHG